MGSHAGDNGSLRNITKCREPFRGAWRVPFACISLNISHPFVTARQTR